MPSDPNPAAPSSPDPAEPARVTVDDQTVQSHGLRDQLDAADRRDATDVTRKRRTGVRFQRILPGGTV